MSSKAKVKLCVFGNRGGKRRSDNFVCVCMWGGTIEIQMIILFIVTIQ